MEPIKELPEGIEEWKGYRQILEIIVDSISDEIMNLVEYINGNAGILSDESDEFYEQFEEPVEELLWKKICESLTP